MARRLNQIFFLIIVILGLLFPHYTEFDTGETFVSDQSDETLKNFDTAMYLKYQIDEFSLVFGGTRHLAAYSGGLSRIDSNTDITMNGAFDVSLIQIEQKYGLNEFVKHNGKIFVAQSWYSNSEFSPHDFPNSLIFLDYDSYEGRKVVQSTYNVRYCIISEDYLVDQQKVNEKYFYNQGPNFEGKTHFFVESVIDSDNFILYDNGRHQSRLIY